MVQCSFLQAAEPLPTGGALLQTEFLRRLLDNFKEALGPEEQSEMATGLLK